MNKKNTDYDIKITTDQITFDEIDKKLDEEIKAEKEKIMASMNKIDELMKELNQDE